MDGQDFVELIAGLYDNMGIEYKYNAEKQVFCGHFTVEKTRSFRLVIGHGEDEIMIFISIEDFRADLGEMDQLLSFINMINWRIKSGKIAVDMEDGEIRYDSYISTLWMETPPVAILESIVLMGCNTMVRYYEGLLTLAIGFSDAISEMESVMKQENK